jgi:hypothetical protein
MACWVHRPSGYCGLTVAQCLTRDLQEEQAALIQEKQDLEVAHTEQGNQQQQLELVLATTQATLENTQA